MRTARKAPNAAPVPIDPAPTNGSTRPTTQPAKPMTAPATTANPTRLRASTSADDVDEVPRCASTSLDPELDPELDPVLVLEPDPDPVESATSRSSRSMSSSAMMQLCAIVVRDREWQWERYSRYRMKGVAMTMLEPESRSWTTTKIVAVIVAILTVGYMLPWALAAVRDVPHWGVFWLNLLLGWTLIGWIVALVLSLRSPSYIVKG